MSNTLLTISDITNESLMILENELVLADKVNREYDDRSQWTAPRSATPSTSACPRASRAPLGRH
jgi:hypothetical protein